VIAGIAVIARDRKSKTLQLINADELIRNRAKAETYAN
jgi:hypothetical protein